MIAQGDLQGLRIDHIDGLFDPRGYCERLQRCSPGPLYVLVEKILASHEMLPDWPVAGTTGYDFVNQVLALFVDPAGEAADDPALSPLYRPRRDLRRGPLRVARCASCGSTSPAKLTCSRANSIASRCAIGALATSH